MDIFNQEWFLYCIEAFLNIYKIGVLSSLNTDTHTILKKKIHSIHNHSNTIQKLFRLRYLYTLPYRKLSCPMWDVRYSGVSNKPISLSQLKFQTSRITLLVKESVDPQAKHISDDSPVSYIQDIQHDAIPNFERYVRDMEGYKMVYLWKLT